MKMIQFIVGTIVGGMIARGYDVPYADQPSVQA